MEVYNTYSKYLQERYGEKVYKLPIKLPITCPNRDGTLSKGGCTFCGEEGGSFENLPDCMSVKDQIGKNMLYIRERYKAKKFIAYFQNFSNTYMTLEDFKEYIKDAIVDDVVAISISTRPDCINDKYLKFLVEIKNNMGIDIIIELGLQSVNYHSLIKINRGHTLAEFIDAVIRIKAHDLRVCTHLILNLPWDDMRDVIENAKIISALGIDEVKLHSLYIIENTSMAEQFKNGEIDIISKEEYIHRVITFLEYLDPGIIIQRIMGRAPEEKSIFVNWSESWWKIRDEIVSIMEKENRQQGKKFDYLNGKALKNF
ncbi:TIGR01212 family radical SAM protein [Tissierella creatinini]|nr:TIGR01212 family radical SAM protein [Tissierella creatinini]TJX63801.1 TIGR01212 family radical SAM protein [Soehngenia saccharolytica]